MSSNNAPKAKENSIESRVLNNAGSKIYGDKHNIEDGEPTTGYWESILSDVFSKAAEDTMAVMGYNVVAEGDQVVKIYANGTKEKIASIERRKKPEKIILR